MKRIINPLPLGMVKSFLLQGNTNILVDAGLLKSPDKIRKELDRIGVKVEAISLIILTHNHPDHIGGLTVLKQLSGARVLMHHLEADFLARGQDSPAAPQTGFAKILMRMFPKSEGSGIKSDLTFKDEFDLRPYGLKAKVVHTPGHTDGSASIVFENGEAVVGDLINGRMGPFGRAASLPFLLSSRKANLSSMKMLLERGVRTFHMAHGKSCTADTVKKLVARY